MMKANKPAVHGAALIGLVLALCLIWTGLGMGSVGWQSPWAAWSDEGMRQIVWEIRAPRTLGALLVGALLGLGGAVAQGLFRNPLAEPYLLGTSSGACLGLVLMLTLGEAWVATSPDAASLLGRLGLTGAAFVGAVAGVSLTLTLSRGAAQTMRLLLCGVVVGVVLGALTELVLLWSADAWRTMRAFMLGNTAMLSWSACGVMGLVLGVTLPAAWLLSRVLDALSLGEDTARTLGIPLGMARGVLVGVLALSTAAAVAQAGLVAFVGLVAPHLARPWAGARHATMLWASCLLGGLLLLSADVLARTLIAPQELPVGVLTAVMGGVYLLVLLHRRAVA